MKRRPGAEAAHESSDAPPSNLEALIDELAQDARTAVRSATNLEGFDDLRSKLFIIEVALRWLLFSPGVVPAQRDFQHAAKDSHRIGRLLHVDERGPHRFPLAKKTVAFRSISFSIRSSLISLRRRFSSARSSSLIDSFESEAFRTHSPTDFALIPSSIAIADIVRSLCFTSFTISALNSSVNRLRLLFLDISNSPRKTSFLCDVHFSVQGQSPGT